MERLKSWADCRAAGIIIRAFLSAEREFASKLIASAIYEESDEVKTLFAKVENFLAKLYYPSRNSASLQKQIDSNISAIGPSCFLALSDLSSYAKIKSPGALLALHVHVLFLKQANNQFILDYSGEETGKKKLEWPSIYPSKYEAISITADASFMYKARYVVDGKTEKTHNLSVKTMKLGGKLIINVVFEEDSHFSLEVNIKDYIPTNESIREAYEKCISDLSPSNQGFSQFISRASLTLLSNEIVEKLLSPIFNVICPEDMRVNKGNRKTNIRQEEQRDRPSLITDHRSPLQVPGTGRPRYPGGYGDSDLMPSLGGYSPIGGNLFGPGHPGFGSTRPSLPEGVPPGSRYDPIGPGASPNPGSGRMGRRGKRRDGDHLPPPSFGGGGF